MYEIAPLNHSLGCKHVRFENMKDGKRVKGMEYNMVDYMRNCVDTYQNITANGVKRKKVDTSFHPLLTGEILLVPATPRQEEMNINGGKQKVLLP